MARAGRLVALQVAQLGYRAAVTGSTRARPISRIKVRSIAREPHARGNVGVVPASRWSPWGSGNGGSRATSPQLERRMVNGRLKGPAVARRKPVGAFSAVRGNSLAR